MKNKTKWQLFKRALLKTLDKVYFKIKRHLFPPNDVTAYIEGYVNGYNAGRSAVLLELQKKSLYNFTSAELRMGYDYARHVAEQVEPECL